MTFAYAALAVISTLNISYVTSIGQDFFKMLYFTQETAEKSEENNGTKNLADALYAKMQQKDNIFILFFESYGERHRGFYAERNLPNEPKHLILHADDQKNGITAVITVRGEFDSIDSVILKKFRGRDLIKEVSASNENEDALRLYRRMLEASVGYIDRTDVSRDPTGFNIAKYNGHIEDSEFVSSFESLISKMGI